MGAAFAVNRQRREDVSVEAMFHRYETEFLRSYNQGSHWIARERLGARDPRATIEKISIFLCFKGD